jgi:hypothetical protein
MSNYLEACDLFTRISLPGSRNTIRPSILTRILSLASVVCRGPQKPNLLSLPFCYF